MGQTNNELVRMLENLKVQNHILDQDILRMQREMFALKIENNKLKQNSASVKTLMDNILKHTLIISSDISSYHNWGNRSQNITDEKKYEAQVQHSIKERWRSTTNSVDVENAHINLQPVVKLRNISVEPSQYINCAKNDHLGVKDRGTLDDKSPRSPVTTKSVNESNIVSHERDFEDESSSFKSPVVEDDNKAACYVNDRHRKMKDPDKTINKELPRSVTTEESVNESNIVCHEHDSEDESGSFKSFVVEDDNKAACYVNDRHRKMKDPNEIIDMELLRSATTEEYANESDVCVSSERDDNDYSSFKPPSKMMLSTILEDQLERDVSSLNCGVTNNFVTTWAKLRVNKQLADVRNFKDDVRAVSQPVVKLTRMSTEQLQHVNGQSLNVTDASTLRSTELSDVTSDSDGSKVLQSSATRDDNETVYQRDGVSSTLEIQREKTVSSASDSLVHVNAVNSNFVTNRLRVCINEQCTDVSGKKINTFMNNLNTSHLEASSLSFQSENYTLTCTSTPYKSRQARNQEETLNHSSIRLDITLNGDSNQRPKELVNHSGNVSLRQQQQQQQQQQQVKDCVVVLERTDVGTSSTNIKTEETSNSPTEVSSSKCTIPKRNLPRRKATKMVNFKETSLKKKMRRE